MAVTKADPETDARSAATAAAHDQQRQAAADELAAQRLATEAAMVKMTAAQVNQVGDAPPLPPGSLGARIAAATPKIQHGDRRGADAFQPAVHFVKPNEEDAARDEDQEALSAAYDKRNPVVNVTWTNEEGQMTPKERQKLRTKIAQERAPKHQQMVLVQQSLPNSK